MNETSLSPAGLTTLTALVVTGLLIVVNLPWGAVAVVAGATVAGAAVTARTVRALSRPVPSGVAGARAAAVVLVLMGGPAVVAAELGARAVPVLAVLGLLVLVAAVPLLRRPQGPRPRCGDGGQGPRKVAR